MSTIKGIVILSGLLLATAASALNVCAPQPVISNERATKLCSSVCSGITLITPSDVVLVPGATLQLKFSGYWSHNSHCLKLVPNAGGVVCKCELRESGVSGNRGT